MNNHAYSKRTLEEIIVKIETLAKNTLGNEPVHGYPHVERVLRLAFRIAEKYKNEIDLQILKLSILLHDIGRTEEKEERHHAILSAEIAKHILSKYNLSKNIIDKVVEAILSHSFSLKYKPKSLESKILSDADKLDALGAVGVFRVFMESAYHKRTLEEALNHFYEKLLKLKDMMWTMEAKKIAEERHKFMVEFLSKLKREIAAKD